jgi:hypothetical protein
MVWSQQFQQSHANKYVSNSVSTHTFQQQFHVVWARESRMSIIVIIRRTDVLTACYLCRPSVENVAHCCLMRWLHNHLQNSQARPTWEKDPNSYTSLAERPQRTLPYGLVPSNTLRAQMLHELQIAIHVPVQQTIDSRKTDQTDISTYAGF